MKPPTASVIIPAHNEEVGIEVGLAALLDGTADREFEIIVAANGCTDSTVQVARSFADRGVLVIDLPEPCKIGALRAGDDLASLYPRIYLDADVVMTAATARALVSELTGPILAAAPRIHADLRGLPFFAARYLSVWLDLPAFRSSYVGSGCYALSAEGRRRFGIFPDITNDDQFVNELFSKAEKLTMPHHFLEVRPPRNLRSIIRRSLRVRAGRMRLSAEPPTSAPKQRPDHRGPSTSRYLVSMAFRRGKFSSVLIFTTVQVLIVVVARLRRLAGRDSGWMRDESSRSTSAALKEPA